MFLINFQHSHKIHVEYEVEVRSILTQAEVKERNIKVEPFPGSKISEGKVNTQ